MGAIFHVGAMTKEGPVGMNIQALSPEVALKIGKKELKERYPGATGFSVSYKKSSFKQTEADFKDPNRTEADEQ